MSCYELLLISEILTLQAAVIKILKAFFDHMQENINEKDRKMVINNKQVI